MVVPVEEAAALGEGAEEHAAVEPVEVAAAEVAVELAQRAVAASFAGRSASRRAGRLESRL